MTRREKLEKEFLNFQNEYPEFVQRGLEIKAVDNRLLNMIKLIITLGDEIRLYDDFGVHGLCLFSEDEVNFLMARQFIVGDMIAEAREEINKAMQIAQEKNKLYLQDFDKEGKSNTLFTCERLLEKSQNKIVKMLLSKINKIN